jgi:hypothetical protein
MANKDEIIIDRTNRSWEEFLNSDLLDPGGINEYAFEQHRRTTREYLELDITFDPERRLKAFEFIIKILSTLDDLPETKFLTGIKTDINKEKKVTDRLLEFILT